MHLSAFQQESAILPVTKIQLSLDEQQAILNIQHSILQSVSSGDSQQVTLDKLCNMAEALVPESIATVMIMENAAHLDVISAPSVKRDDQLLLCGLQPGPNAGTCGNAVYRNEATYVSNVYNDERCNLVCNVFEQFELSACWSNPIRNVAGEAVGSFALSSFEKRAPSSFHKELLAVGSYIIGIILERSKQQKKLEKLAYEDGLTGLANRESLFSHLEQRMKHVKNTFSAFDLMFLDLKRFKLLNDSFGHKFGDEVLRLVASRLSDCFSANVFVSRLGGDEFVLVLDNALTGEKAANKINEAFSTPFIHQGYEFLIDVSIGIVSYPHDGQTAEVLLTNADTAMYRAKRLGLQFSFYDPTINSKAKKAFMIEKNLRTAIESNHLSLHFQAKVQASNYAVTGYEALLRWNDPVLGAVSPCEFISIAEKTGQMLSIGEWVVTETLKQGERLLHHTKQAFTLAINVSALQLTKEHIAKLISHINESVFPNERIFFEITETVLIEEFRQVSELLELIRGANIKISIDDFGAGYSSLIYLKRFKVSQLKIDKMLIDDIDKNEESLAIAKAVIALGHSLGLEIVAEGVENQAQAEALRRLNCNTIQGYFFSKPALIEEYLS